MEDLWLKVAILAGCFVALYLVATRLSATPSREQQAANVEAPAAEADVPDLLPPPSVLVGRELPLPVDASQLAATDGPGVASPRLLNYYFRKTDLVAGPPDPLAFYDEFFVELEHPETGYRWTASFMVTTPQGLEQVMAEDHTPFLFGNSTIVVQRYDLKTILQAVLESFEEAEGGARNGTEAVRTEPRDVRDLFGWEPKGPK